MPLRGRRRAGRHHKGLRRRAGRLGRSFEGRLRALPREALNMPIRMLQLFAAALFILIFAGAQVVAQKKYDQGATDSKIKIGNIMPYTGIFSEYGAIGRAEAAYFQMINDKGGINGRKINFISVDSGSDSGKSVALAHQLVEEDQVLLTAGIW